MFDLAWSEIAVIGVVAVLVLGPKELPQAMRTMARVMRKMRSLSSELQGHMNEIVREAELDEVRQSIQKLSSTNLAAEVTKAVDPTGELAAELHPSLPAPAAGEVAAAETPAPTPTVEAPTPETVAAAPAEAPKAPPALPS